MHSTNIPLRSLRVLLIQVPQHVAAVGDDKENVLPDVRQGRFVCTFCKMHFYHATAMVAHYEKQHKKMLGTHVPI